MMRPAEREPMLTSKKTRGLLVSDAIVGYLGEGLAKNAKHGKKICGLGFVN